MVLVAAVTARGGVPAAHAADRRESESGSDGGRERQTATPIKHVIIIVGENRSFDHLYATYAPKRKQEKVLNLLSEGIVNADGSPGRNFARAHQFRIASPPNGGKFFISSDLANKQLYSALPAPDVGGVGPVSPYAGILGIPGGDPGLPPEDQFLFATAIADYLDALPFKLDSKCGPGQYWQAVNVDPAFTPKGLVQTGLVVPPTTQRSIGDVLSAHGISWKYYGGGFNADGTASPFNGSYCNICNPFEYESIYPSLVADHMRDVTDLFADLKNGTLPAVSYVKPDGTMDGHPASSKWTLFEAFAENIIQLAQSNKEQWAETAIFVTVDEGGGYYDSGFIQPVDFFGTGPRIPMIAVSPFSTGGRVSHAYNEHSSFVKFVERNWKLGTTLSDRSRDNLPNPDQDGENAYVPRNMPAIGDLFDLFDFGDDRGDDRD